MSNREDAIEVLKSIIDPELYIDIWTLGLIYDIQMDPPHARVRMTFTSPACPAGPQLLGEVKEKLEQLPGIESASVEVVFQPPWEPSEELKATLGLI